MWDLTLREVLADEEASVGSESGLLPVGVREGVAELEGASELSGTLPDHLGELHCEQGRQ